MLHHGHTAFDISCQLKFQRMCINGRSLPSWRPSRLEATASSWRRSSRLEPVPNRGQFEEEAAVASAGAVAARGAEGGAVAFALNADFMTVWDEPREAPSPLWAEPREAPSPQQAPSPHREPREATSRSLSMPTS